MKKFVLSIIVMSLLLGLSACQAGSRVIKDIDNALDEFSTIPDRLVQAFANLIGGIGDVGSAIGEQIGNIIKNMGGP